MSLWNTIFPKPEKGALREWVTGAKRNASRGKGRYDLIDPIFLHRLAKHLEYGAEHIGARNWEKGIPVGSYLDSIERHLQQLKADDNSEDHLAAIAFNVMGAMVTLEQIALGKMSEELDDRTELWNE